MKVRYIIIILLGGILYTIGLLGMARVISDNPERGKDMFGPAVTNTILKAGEIPGSIKSFFSNPNFYIADTLRKDGFSYYSNTIPNYPKLLVSYKTGTHASKIQLLDIKTGRLIREWAPNSKQISKLSRNENNTSTFKKGADLHFSHPLLLKDSSIVINTTYSLVKINSRSEIEWVNNEIWAHHSIELDAEGNIYICGRNFLSAPYDFLPEDPKGYAKIFLDDAIFKVDPMTGEILYKKTIISILQENGYEAMLYNSGFLSSDPIHLNDVQPAVYKGKYWEQGDLLISCRSLSVVFLYRPSTNKVVWLKQGPWLSQHDPNFYGDSQITVFGNDVLMDYHSQKIFENGFHLLKDHNQIYIYDLEKDSISTPFSRLMQNESIGTGFQGQCKLLPNGDIFIEETGGARVIIGDSVSKKVEFVRRVDPENITALNWSRIID